MIRYAVLVSSLFFLGSCSNLDVIPDTVVSLVKNDADGEIFGGKAVKGLSVAVRKSALSDKHIEIILKNESSKDQVLYSSFRVYTGQIGDSSDIFLNVIDTSTQIELTQDRGLVNSFVRNSSMKSFADMHFPQAYVTLKPGDYVSKIYKLTDFFVLSDDKKYTVIVEYDHLESGYEKYGDWVEMNAWAGRCASNKFTLKPKKEQK